MEIIKAIIFGIIQGITEWLPISSTGHMILVNEFITLDVSTAFWEMFLVVIQLASIFAVILLYWRTIWPVGLQNNSTNKQLYLKKDIINLWGKIIIGSIPAAIVGLLLDDWFQRYFYNWWTVAIMLIVVGILFLYVENKSYPSTADSLEQITYKQAFAIGIFQMIAAILPGTSRSGSTIIGGLMNRVSRTAAAEFTFILAIPAMIGASLLKLIKFGFSYTGTELTILLVGMVVSFVVSIFIIRFLMAYIRKHDFKIFAWYRIVLGILVIVYFSL